MSWRATFSALALAAFLTACGDTQGGGVDTATEQATQEQEAACLTVPAVARNSLRDGLKGGRRIGRIAAVRSEGSEAGPTDLNGAVYYVTADVKPSPGLATWAFGERAFTTGGGIIIGVDPAARAVTDFGVDLEPGVVEGWGVTESAEGYRASQGCLG